MLVTFFTRNVFAFTTIPKKAAALKNKIILFLILFADIVALVQHNFANVSQTLRSAINTNYKLLSPLPTLFVADVRCKFVN